MIEIEAGLVYGSLRRLVSTRQVRGKEHTSRVLSNFKSFLGTQTNVGRIAVTRGLEKSDGWYRES